MRPRSGAGVGARLAGTEPVPVGPPPVTSSGGRPRPVANRLAGAQERPVDSSAATAAAATHARAPGTFHDSASSLRGVRGGPLSLLRAGACSVRARARHACKYSWGQKRTLGSLKLMLTGICELLGAGPGNLTGSLKEHCTLLFTSRTLNC